MADWRARTYKPVPHETRSHPRRLAFRKELKMYFLRTFMTDDPEEGLKDRPTDRSTAYVLYNNRQEAHTTPSFAFTLTPVTGKRPRELR